MVSKNETKILNFLKEYKNEIAVNILAEKTGIDLSNISRYWKSLEEQGLISYRTEQIGRIRTTYLSLINSTEIPTKSITPIEKKETSQKAIIPKIEIENPKIPITKTNIINYTLIESIDTMSIVELMTLYHALTKKEIRKPKKLIQKELKKLLGYD